MQDEIDSNIHWAYTKFGLTIGWVVVGLLSAIAIAFGVGAAVLLWATAIKMISG